MYTEYKTVIMVDGLMGGEDYFGKLWEGLVAQDIVTSWVT